MRHAKEKKVDDSILPKLTEFDILRDFEIFRDGVGEFKLPRFSEFPAVGLYMDQVVSLVDKYFSIWDRDDDRPIITSSMINNYVKLGVMPPPEKKRYWPEHLAYLIMICLLKQVLSMNEIRLLIGWNSDELKEKYDNFCSLAESIFSDLDIADPTDPLSLSLMALTTKLYAQKIIKIQLDALREETAKLAPRDPDKPDKPEKEKDKDKAKEKDKDKSPKKG